MGPATKRCRRFTVLDGMILVAATAAGFGLWRAAFFDPSRKSPAIWVPEPLLSTTALLYVSATPIIATEMIGYLVIRFRKPRARFRRIMGQPGMVACVTALGFLVIGTMVLCRRLWPFWNLREREDVVLLEFASSPVGMAVLVAWAVQALSQRWRRERGWIDSLGMILGIYWIGAAASLFYLEYMVFP